MIIFYAIIRLVVRVTENNIIWEWLDIGEISLGIGLNPNPAAI